MKIPKWKTLLLAAGLILPLVAAAQDDTNEYVMTWQGTEFMTGANGKIVSRHFTQNDFVEEVAANNGLNPKSLEFVYRADKRDTVVVNKSDGTFVADVIQLQYTFTDVSNAPGTTIETFSVLNDEGHVNAIGSAFGTQTTHFNKSGAVTSFSYHGTMQYAFPETNAVFSGSFSTGRRVNIPAAHAALNRATPANPNSAAPVLLPVLHDMRQGVASATVSRARS